MIKTVLKDLKAQRKFTILNLIGLCIGFTFLSLITLFVIREFSYDRFHAKADSIYMLEFVLKNDDGTINRGKRIDIKQVDALKTQIPGISNITFLNYSYFDWDNGTWIKFNNKEFQLHRMAFTNAALADIFSFKTISANLKEALNDPRSLVLTEDNAKKIFGKEDPIGKSVLLNNQPVIISAIIESNPFQSSIRFDGLINFQASKYFTGQIIDDYSNLAFLEIDPKANLKNIEAGVKDVFLQDVPKQDRILLQDKLKVNLLSLKNSYFSEGEAFDPMFHGNKTLVSIILIIGVLILALAVINYINLSYAGSFRKQKELAIRSIFGASRLNLILSFLTGSILISLFAFVLSLFIAEIPLPWFNRMIDNPLYSKQLFQSGFIILLALVVIFTGFISGIFPAIAATRRSSLLKIKGDNQKLNKSRKWKYLVVFQMVISIGLISGTISIMKQMHFAKNIDMGFNIENVVTIPVFKLGSKMSVYLESINNNSATEASALSSTYLNTFNLWGGKLNDGVQEKEISYYVIRGNADFLNATGIQLTRGRNFEKESAVDANSCIINETAVKQYGLTDPLSAKISGCPIVGVVNDFHIQSLHYKVGPIVIYNSPIKNTGLATIHFKSDNKVQSSNYITFLKTSWESFATGNPFEYELLDQRLQNMYEKDERLMNAFSSFSILAIIIASLGLFGLISSMAETKVKEIGIRKVNGARISEILTMLNKDFIILVAIAFVIAFPISWYILHKWLQNFAYKTELSWWIFGLSGILALGIALLTVSWQSWRASTRNPVEALRYE
jgi:putative ABC transport system permease protein